MKLEIPERPLRSLRYVLLGTLGGAGYALLNTSMDYLHGRGLVARTFVALHSIVDEVIPPLVGALLGVGVHYWRLRSRVARDEKARADELRARVEHVERDQAVWVVAAATLHELKNPLHAIGLLVDELEQTPATDAEAVRDLHARMRAQMDRALVPLDALRSLSEPHRGHGGPAALADIAARVVRELAPVTNERGVNVVLEAIADSTVHADPSFVRIILENLIGNSLDGMRHSSRASGRIRVRIEREADHVELTVSDDGPGLGAPALSSLFHPLETAKHDGLGLGLSIARALARAMNGELAYAVLPGWSTTFRLSLPLEREPQPS